MLKDDDISALRLEGFKTDEQTVYCATLSSTFSSKPNTMAVDAPMHTEECFLLQATTSGIRLIGIRSLRGRGCLVEWHPPSGRGVSSLSSHKSLVVVASGMELYALEVTGSPESPTFEQIA